MLAVFEKSISNPPEELSLPSLGLENSMNREEILQTFRSSSTEVTVYNLTNGNFMALSHDDTSYSHPRSIVVLDDVFCIFIGTLVNTSDLRRHYGLPRQATEAIVVVEAYKVLRDRAPYPIDQVIKDLQGNFAFVLFDANSGTLFTSRDRNGSVELHWGLAGCIFRNGSGLLSFDHPLNKVRAITHKDDDFENICGVSFQVDLYTRIPSIPRSGSASNWADQESPPPHDHHDRDDHDGQIELDFIS
ncbi:hypothetical protein F8388_000464 [Cannabis sativa]|uniref:DUF3700 domain-containing protein n=1 Tax=Cannabis sativa TaxID=3483 RepID=A0A7J6F1K5_CANSA|nr:hypothetical protein F8388_000464 [Cannabis sativa]KAF4394074.1 hypothetical protein G4B88_026043 [Cannabis sativa]